MPLPGIEPGPRPSEGRVRSPTLRGHCRIDSAGRRSRTLSIRFGIGALSREDAPVGRETGRERQGARGELNPPLRDPRSRVLPLHHGHHRRGPRSATPGAEGAGVEPARLIARPPSRRVPSPVGWPFRSANPPAEGEGFEPPCPCAGALVSNEARRTVSGYLPSTDREWTAGESNPDLLVAGQASSRWTSRPRETESSPRESNPRLPDVSRAPCRWTRGRRKPKNDGRDGSRTHRHRPLMPAALPVCLPGRRMSPRPRTRTGPSAS